jgi:hypothetical protein
MADGALIRSPFTHGSFWLCLVTSQSVITVTALTHLQNKIIKTRTAGTQAYANNLTAREPDSIKAGGHSVQERSWRPDAHLF